ncbi:MAG: S8 family serine peptidase, partial [Candidatus Tumulicola sp.]
STVPAALAVLALAACASQTAPVMPVQQIVQSQSPQQPLGLVQYNGATNVAAACPVPDTGIPGAPQCYALLRTDAAGMAGHILPPGQTPDGYGPSDFRSAYNLPSKGGSGQTVALVDFYDDPNAESDLAVYRAEYGLPPCTTENGCFRKVNQDGKQSHYPKPSGGWAGEIAIDIEMASAVCPQCHILLVEASTSGNKGEDTAIALGADVVSNSWGYYGKSPYDKAFDHPGHIITVASGDSGYSKRATVPDSLSTVVSVGGTSLRQATNTRGWSETAWRGSTSECNVLVKKPAWQLDTGCTGRTETDVSAVADPGTGVAVYDSYKAPGWVIYGGTSVASPIVAGIYALAANEKSLTYAQSLYTNAADLNDVVSGDNGDCNTYICDAGPGYDGPTGNGTPNGLKAF